MKIVRYLLLFICSCSTAWAGQSTIMDTEGMGCLEGEPRSQEARRIAETDAKRLAAERVQTFITSTSEVVDFALKKDLIEAYSTAEVKVLSVLSEVWDDSEECVTIAIHAEVRPVSGNLDTEEVMELLLADPMAPLTVRVWTNKDSYSPNDIMQIYVKGNKPFYGMLTYRDVEGNILQILPNPNRRENFFNGGVVYTVPGNGDTFDLVVEPPFGEETLSLYASSMPLGDVSKIDIGAAFQVKDSEEKIAAKTRGLKLVKQPSEGRVARDKELAEFNQVSLQVSVVE